MLVPALCALVYCILIRPDQANYFRELGGALLHGQLYLAHPSQTHDLVFFGGKYYLYWPPVPALVFAPLVAIFGPGVSDGFVSCVFGVTNVWLFMRICQQLSARFNLGLTTKELFWAGMFWGFGTVHFYMAKTGSTWFISQVIAQTFLLASIYSAIRGKSWVLTGLFFALAVYTRNNLIFGALFFPFLYGALYPGRPFVKWLRDGLSFAIPVLLCSALNGWYNWARFGDPFENGLSYHLMDDYFRPLFNQWGYFSWHYFPHNFYTEVLHAPTLVSTFPFLMEEPEGFGFLWASPFFFWLFPALALWVYRIVTRKGSASYWLVTTGSLLAAIPIACTIFMIMGTGWRQFGARYTLDFQLFLLLFLLVSWPHLRKLPLAKPISITLMILSFIIEGIGAG